MANVGHAKCRAPLAIFQKDVPGSPMRSARTRSGSVWPTPAWAPRPRPMDVLEVVDAVFVVTFKINRWSIIFHLPLLSQLLQSPWAHPSLRQTSLGLSGLQAPSRMNCTLSPAWHLLIALGPPQQRRCQVSNFTSPACLNTEEADSL